MFFMGSFICSFMDEKVPHFLYLTNLILFLFPSLTILIQCLELESLLSKYEVKFFTYMHLNLSGSRKNHICTKFYGHFSLQTPCTCKFSQLCHNLLHACIFPSKVPYL